MKKILANLRVKCLESLLRRGATPICCVSDSDDDGDDDSPIYDLSLSLSLSLSDTQVTTYVQQFNNTNPF